MDFQGGGQTLHLQLVLPNLHETSFREVLASSHEFAFGNESVHRSGAGFTSVNRGVGDAKR